MPPPNQPIFSESFAAVISRMDCRIAQLLQQFSKLKDLEIMEKCACRNCNKKAKKLRWIRKMFNPRFGNYFSWREKDGMVSYLPTGKEITFADDGHTWARKSRQEISPGRWVRKIFTDRVNKRIRDEYLKNFTNQFEAKENEERVSFAEAKIEEIYGSEAPHSCMKGQGKHLARFYAMFPCVGFAAKQRGKIVARAILWTEVQGQPEPRKFLDRIYPNEGPFTQALIEHAMKQGWYYKATQGASERSICLDGAVVGDCNTWKVMRKEETNVGALTFHPYMDTMCRSDSGLTFLTPSPNRGGWVYQTQNGTRTKDDYGMVRCPITDTRVDIDACVQFEGTWFQRIHMVRCRYTNIDVPITMAFKVHPPGEDPFYVSQRFINRA